ncbi:MAG: hypothetical protein SO158_06140, partial [Bacteroidaceae bacterium]|nr:hypothetical protein [Bacteroidaceae bacterium]
MIGSFFTFNNVSLGFNIVHATKFFQVSQVESENKRKRSRHAPKGQRAHSPGHRPGYDEAMKCALKG